MHWVILKMVSIPTINYNANQLIHINSAEECIVWLRNLIYPLITSGNWEFYPELTSLNLDISAITTISRTTWRLINQFGHTITIFVIESNEISSHLPYTTYTF